MSDFEKKYHQSFNARYMTFEQIAKSFIISDHFQSIIKQENTVLIGSRGCGKTTLLKMLHPKALVAWNTDEAQEIKRNINFNGIYIPSDLQWKSQFETFTNKFPKDDSVTDIFRGVINANVLIAICSTFNALIEFSDVKATFEVELARKLIDNWDISKPISPNLDEITIRIRKMVSDFNSYYRRGLIDKNLPELCYKNYIDLISIAIDCFETINKRGEYGKISCKEKWALCFDELEITPKFFQEDVNNNRRGILDQRLILKVTTVPDIDEVFAKKDILAPREIDDFTPLKLWAYDNKSQKLWRSFCEKYMKRELSNYYNKGINLDILFGKSIDYNKGLKTVESFNFAKSKYDGDDGKRQFEEGGIMWKVMQSLQEYDKSFYNYLKKKNIDPLNPVPIDKKQEDSVHRKIKPIVLYRYYFTKGLIKKIGIKQRSRNINVFNHGKEFIFDIADGNPRSLAHLVSEFVDKASFKNGILQEMPIPLQSRLIYEFSKNYFYKRILNYPQKNINNNKSLIEIIDKIGNYFYDKIVLEDFNPDPFIFFYVNLEENDLINFIEIALEAGAIFKVETEIGIKGVRRTENVYRLSYSLYPIYKIPKVDYNPIPLSRILKENKTDSSPNLFPNINEI